MRASALDPKFVEFIPKELENGVLYISIEYATVVHTCCCGCQQKVVTPLSPTDWSLIYDGETVSLTPSIGNWSFACQSHYWIRRNTVQWAPRWTREQIESGRAADRAAKDLYYATGGHAAGVGHAPSGRPLPLRERIWKRLVRLMRRRS